MLARSRVRLAFGGGAGQGLHELFLSEYVPRTTVLEPLHALGTARRLRGLLSRGGGMRAKGGKGERAQAMEGRGGRNTKSTHLQM